MAGIEEELQKVRRILAECTGTMTPVVWRLVKALESLVAIVETQQRQLDAQHMDTAGQSLGVFQTGDSPLFIHFKDRW